MPNITRPFTTFAATLALLAPLPLAAPPAHAQEAGPLIPLAAQPFEIPSLGIAITLPERAYTSVQTIAGAQATALVYPGESNQKWQMAIKSHRSANTKLTNTEALDEIIRQIKLTKPVTDARKGGVNRDDLLNKNFEYSRIQVTSRTPGLDIGGVPAERVYLSAPQVPDYPDSGITIFNPEPGVFMLVHLEAPHGTMDSLKPMYETVCASVAYKDASEVTARRAAAVLATDELFADINASDLEMLLDKQLRFFRLFRPSESGRPMDDKDVAWQRISIRSGQAGEINPGKARTSWGAEDREYGFIMQIEARALWLNFVVDSQGIFFLSRDREHERWSLKNTVRKETTTDTTTQTLIRKGENLSYVVERPGEPRFTGEFVIPERGYLSKIEATLLPRIVASRDIPGEFAYYAFDPGLDTIALKYESFDRDGTGRWQSTFKHVENALPQTSVYDENGVIVRRTTADGQRMVPIDPERLRTIWNTKDLPID